MYFLLGELPIEAQIHRDVFSLFYNVWINPNSKISQIIKYLLQNSPEKSKTWSIFVRNLAVKYDLTDPLECLNSNAPSKANYKEHITTKISAYHEKSLRAGVTNNSRMKYFNISFQVFCAPDKESCVVRQPKKDKSCLVPCIGL